MKHFMILTNFEGNLESRYYWADDKEHAIEQMVEETDEYNPEQYIVEIFVSDSTIMTAQKREDFIHDEHCEKMDFLTELNVGDEVYWHDPDDGLCSADYKIAEIETESGKIENLWDVVLLVNDDSETQALACELCEWEFS
jgi:hypothetical protein